MKAKKIEKFTRNARKIVAIMNAHWDELDELEDVEAISMICSLRSYLRESADVIENLNAEVQELKKEIKTFKK